MKYRGVELVWYHNNWYHPNFFSYRRDQCLKRAKYTCQHCKVPRGGWYLTKEGRLDSAVIQACHVYRDDTWNPRAKLIALCKQCHLAYDAPMHGEKSAATKKRNKSDLDRKLAKEKGQKDLPLKNKQRGRPRKEQLTTLIPKSWEDQMAEKRAMKPREYKKNTLKSEQVSLFVSEGDELFPYIQVDYPIATFLQSVRSR